MSTADIPYSTSSQEALISATLNAALILYNLLMGVYTMVYVGTMYVYLSKKAVNINRGIVLSAISILYLLCFMYFILQWYFINLAVVTNGFTRESIFMLTIEGGPRWIVTFNNFLLYSSLIVSDGLLIWRCYHVWGQSIRVISVTSILFLAELGLSSSVVLLQAIFGSPTTESQATLYNRIESAVVFMPLGTTVITTCLIGYRINSASQENGLPSKRLFNRIVMLVMEPAAFYSLVLCLDAIIIVLPTSRDLGSIPGIQVQYYLEVLLSIVAGLAPTVLVARIALTTNSNNEPASSITHISGLQFGSQQGSVRSENDTRGEVRTSMATGDANVAPALLSKVKEPGTDDTSV